LFFGSTEQFLRRLAEQASDARYVVVDFKRVNLADTAAHRLIARAARAMAGAQRLVLLRSRRWPARTLAAQLTLQEGAHVRCFKDGAADGARPVACRWPKERQDSAPLIYQGAVARGTVWSRRS
jgi:MFS superfamily sulfate permease-like transporter